eukprot:scaffold46913_cov26-Tisochrysis_lutea.AAC.2
MADDEGLIRWPLVCVGRHLIKQMADDEAGLRGHRPSHSALLQQHASAGGGIKGAERTNAEKGGWGSKIGFPEDCVPPSWNTQ